MMALRFQKKIDEIGQASAHDIRNGRFIRLKMPDPYVTQRPGASLSAISVRTLTTPSQATILRLRSSDRGDSAFG